jgi:hypothetical protein
MRGLIVAFSLTLAAIVPANAVTRADASKMTCAEVRERIREEGAVILRYRSASEPPVQHYGRYVIGDRMCTAGTTKSYPTTVVTSDNQACPVRVCDISR